MESTFMLLARLVLMFTIHQTVVCSDDFINCNVTIETAFIVFEENLTNVDCTHDTSDTKSTTLHQFEIKGISTALKNNGNWEVLNCHLSNVNAKFCVHGPTDLKITGTDALVVGRSTNITCLINNVYPAPQIFWYLGSNSSLDWSNHTQPDNKTSLFKASSTLFFTPELKHQGLNLTCSVFPSVPNTWTPGNASIKLDILIEYIEVVEATSSSLLLKWQPESDNLTLRYYKNNTVDMDCEENSPNRTCPVSGLNGTSYNLIGLEPFQWYNLILEADGREIGQTEASTAPSSPDYYGVYLLFTPAKEILKIRKFPFYNGSIPSDLCFTIQTKDEIQHCSTACNETTLHGVKEDDIPKFEVVSVGHGLCSLPFDLVLNSTDERPTMNMPHVSIVMGAVIAASILVLLSSVALLLFLNFICKNMGCLGKKDGDDLDDETLMQVIHKDTTRKVNKDGLVYVEVAHDHAHPLDAPPIRTEEPTVYALLDSDAMATNKKDANGLVYVEVAHDHDHPPDAPPIQTEKPTVYATLDMEAMATLKETEEKKNDVKDEKQSADKEKEGVSGDEKDAKKEKEKDERSDDKKIDDDIPPIAMQPNYENIDLTKDGGLKLPLETNL